MQPSRCLRPRAALAWWLSLVPLLVLTAACQPRRDRDRLIVASRNRIDTVDPAAASTIGAMQLLSAIGDPLYAVRSDGSIEPRLATALPRISADGLQVVVPLRRGVQFHDGTPFNAAAMVFTLERFLAIGTLSYLLGDRVTGVRAMGSHTLELRLRKPFAAVPQLLSAINLTPLSPAAYRRHSRQQLSDRFVGTGPYRLSFFTPQQQRLEPFARYWGRQPANRGLDLVALSNSTALYGALQSGEVDGLLSSSLEIDHQVALQHQAERGALRQATGPALNIVFLSLLSDQPPLNNPLLRRALALSLDRQRLIERVSQGLMAPLQGLIPPAIPGGVPQPWPAYNPAAARRLYRQAGYCGGRRLPLELTFRSNVPSDRLFALSWQALLQRDLGDCVALNVQGMETTTAYRLLGEGAFELIVLDWMGDFPDADNYLVPLLGCEQADGAICRKGGSASSGSFWSRPGLEADLQRSATLRGAERLDLVRRLQRQTAAASPYLPLWLVQPRIWVRRELAQPRFDGSGRVLLQELRRR
ncbi:MAG: ABC transporter substrate-binding protein [Cyanobacteriota bacterium]|nr:ABC transporter substrate-binding protein [Cyanobacteriota bacterium]